QAFARCLGLSLPLALSPLRFKNRYMRLPGFLSTAILMMIALSVQAQVWTEPAFPTQFDDITVYYDATQGNGALAGFQGDVYAHCGLITSESANGNDW